MQLRDEALRRAGQRAPQRGKLEQQWPGSRAQALAYRLDEMLDRITRVEEALVGLAPSAVLAVDPRAGQQAGRLDDEAEAVGHLPGITRVLARRQRRIKRPVHADRAEQRMLCISSEPVARQVAWC